MRVGVNGWRIHGQRTGIGRYLHNIVTRWTPERLAGRFDEVTFYSHRPIDRSEIGLPPTIRERVLKPEARMLLWENLRFGPAADDDVLFCPSYSRPAVARAPVVVAIHDSITQTHPQLLGPGVKLYNALYRWSALKSALVLTSTEAARRDISSGWDVPMASIRVVPLAAPADFEPHLDEAAGGVLAERLLGGPFPYFLHVGKTSGRRRMPVLMESFAEFKRTTGLPHKLVLVGSKPHQDLTELLERLELTDDVCHSGFVSDRELNLLYCWTQALVCPSVYETVSLPIMEAQATGAPVICVDSPGSREITGGAAYFMPELNTGNLLAGLRALAVEDGRCEELRGAGLANSRQYTWDRTASETLDVLAEAAAR